MASTSVDSASPGRKLVDSLFSASVYLPGRFAAPDANSASRQRPPRRTWRCGPPGPSGSVTRGSSSKRGGKARVLPAVRRRRSADARTPRALTSHSGPSEQRGELARLGHRTPADEVLAHVRGRPPIDGLAPLEQGDAVRRPAGDDDVRPESAANDALERPGV